MPGANRKPLVAADNFLDYAVVNRDHDVTAPLGSGVLSGSLRALWDGRRGSRSTVTIDRDGTDDAVVQVDLPSDDAPTFLWLDAGHNMDGESVKVQRYDQTGGFQEDVYTGTVGTTSGNAVALDDGSWAVDLGSPTVDDRWRILFDGVAADPVLSNIFLGKGFHLGNYLKDFARDDSREVDYPGSMRSQRGVRGFGQTPVVDRFVRCRYRTTLNEWDSGSNTIEDLMALIIDKRAPVLWCVDWSTHPERMRLYINRASVIDPAWKVAGYREMDFDLTEVL